MHRRSRKSELIFPSSNTKIVGEKYRKYNFVEFPILMFFRNYLAIDGVFQYSIVKKRNKDIVLLTVYA